MARHILIIDRLITANGRELARRAKLTIREQFLSSAWQRAWDANPGMAERRDALYAERAVARVALDRAAERADLRQKAALRAFYARGHAARRLSADCA